MPGNYTLRRTYVDGDILSASDYVADHQQHIDNQTPQGTDDYSANVTQMRTFTDTGNVNSESLATSLAGELERLRYQIKHIKEAVSGSTLTQWYSKNYSLVVPNSSITAAKLADGATHIQHIRATATTQLITALDPADGALITQGITTTRTRVRVRGYVNISFIAGSATTVIIKVKNDATTVATVTVVVSSDTCIPIELLDTEAAGTKTYTLTGNKNNGNAVTATFSQLILEEVA